MRIVDANKRDLTQQLENDRIKMNTILNEYKELLLAQSNDKLDKIRDDLYIRIRDIEKVYF
jgi:hypothetical protein